MLCIDAAFSLITANLRSTNQIRITFYSFLTSECIFSFTHWVLVFGDVIDVPKYMSCMPKWVLLISFSHTGTSEIPRSTCKWECQNDQAQDWWNLEIIFRKVYFNYITIVIFAPSICEDTSTKIWKLSHKNSGKSSINFGFFMSRSKTLLFSYFKDVLMLILLFSMYV